MNQHPIIKQELHEIVREIPGFLEYRVETQDSALKWGVFHYSQPVGISEKIRLMEKIGKLLGSEVDGQRLGNSIAIWNPKLFSRAVVRGNRIHFLE